MKNFLALFGAGIIFGTFGIWIRILSQELTTYQQIALRNLIGLIFAAFMVYLLKQKWSSLKKANKLSLLLYAVFFPISVIFYVLAMLKTKIAIAVFAFFASGFLFSLLFGKKFFQDKINKNKIASIISAFIGLIFLSHPFSFFSFNLGFIFGIISGFFDSATNIFRRSLGAKIDKFVLTAIQMLGGLTVTAFLMLLTKQSFLVKFSPLTTAVALLFGFLLMIVNFLTLVGFQNFDLNLGTVILSSELVFATIFAALIFQEFPSFLELIGGFFIILAIFIANFPLLLSQRRHGH